ncbi:MAG: 4-(cytidine 5'-diphospho)-2-C-methyl-D-erythritol kinase [Peptococcaceae bacterium]|jgi:4-diphosphocytidyl-2-C-methyl-D-erythritol kinase|nr:4-(cytidine 5'-diphospho)-2-C-methyl-D-erythritol kinase [Peptococcaceae bacterium]
MTAKKQTLRAYAKINLALAVVKRRTDGYHELESVMQTISLHDTVEICLEGRGIICDCGEWSGPGNLAYQAAAIFTERLNRADDGVAIRISKRIPAEAGLAGGSSDAAAVLRGLNQLYGKPFAESSLIGMSVALGADVAYFLRGGTAWIRGLGEIYEELPTLSGLDLVIVQPARGVNTGASYRLWDTLQRDAHPLDRPAWQQALRAGDREQIAGLLANDLEASSLILVPEIAAVKQELMAAGCLGALMSGSGSAVFGIASSGAAAALMTEDMRRRGWRVWQAAAVPGYA